MPEDYDHAKAEAAHLIYESDVDSVSVCMCMHVCVHVYACVCACMPVCRDNQE